MQVFTSPSLRGSFCYPGRKRDAFDRLCVVVFGVAASDAITQSKLTSSSLLPRRHVTTRHRCPPPSPPTFTDASCVIVTGYGADARPRQVPLPQPASATASTQRPLQHRYQDISTSGIDHASALYAPSPYFQPQPPSPYFHPHPPSPYFHPHPPSPYLQPHPPSPFLGLYNLPGVEEGGSPSPHPSMALPIPPSLSTQDGSFAPLPALGFAPPGCILGYVLEGESAILSHPEPASPAQPQRGRERKVQGQRYHQGTCSMASHISPSSRPLWKRPISAHSAVSSYQPSPSCSLPVRLEAFKGPLYEYGDCSRHRQSTTLIEQIPPLYAHDTRYGCAGHHSPVPFTTSLLFLFLFYRAPPGPRHVLILACFPSIMHFTTFRVASLPLLSQTYEPLFRLYDHRLHPHAPSMLSCHSYHPACRGSGCVCCPYIYCDDHPRPSTSVKLPYSAKSANARPRGRAGGGWGVASDRSHTVTVPARKSVSFDIVVFGFGDGVWGRKDYQRNLSFPSDEIRPVEEVSAPPVPRLCVWMSSTTACSSPEQRFESGVVLGCWAGSAERRQSPPNAGYYRLPDPSDKDEKAKKEKEKGDIWKRMRSQHTKLNSSKIPTPIPLLSPVAYKPYELAPKLDPKNLDTPASFRGVAGLLRGLGVHSGRGLPTSAVVTSDLSSREPTEREKAEHSDSHAVKADAQTIANPLECVEGVSLTGNFLVCRRAPKRLSVSLRAFYSHTIAIALSRRRIASAQLWTTHRRQGPLLGGVHRVGNSICISATWFRQGRCTAGVLGVARFYERFSFSPQDHYGVAPEFGATNHTLNKHSDRTGRPHQDNNVDTIQQSLSSAGLQCLADVHIMADPQKMNPPVLSSLTCQTPRQYVLPQLSPGTRRREGRVPAGSLASQKWETMVVQILSLGTSIQQPRLRHMLTPSPMRTVARTRLLPVFSLSHLREQLEHYWTHVEYYSMHGLGLHKLWFVAGQMAPETSTFLYSLEESEAFLQADVLVDGLIRSLTTRILNVTACNRYFAHYKQEVDDERRPCLSLEAMGKIPAARFDFRSSPGPLPVESLFLMSAQATTFLQPLHVTIISSTIVLFAMAPVCRKLIASAAPSLAPHHHHHQCGDAPLASADSHFEQDGRASEHQGKLGLWLRSAGPAESTRRPLPNYSHDTPRRGSVSSSSYRRVDSPISRIRIGSKQISQAGGEQDQESDGWRMREGLINSMRPCGGASEGKSASIQCIHGPVAVGSSGRSAFGPRVIIDSAASRTLALFLHVNPSKISHPQLYVRFFLPSGENSSNAS
ncbi:hypothetical protein NMY22_g4947 [Coprinellus aureogranulatus]|nr:hypothetical protein NMY22_g4947 [Coprinellus aureogranulatus]